MQRVVNVYQMYLANCNDLAAGAHSDPATVVEDDRLGHGELSRVRWQLVFFLTVV